jgi:hypothetical protein
MDTLGFGRNLRAEAAAFLHGVGGLCVFGDVEVCRLLRDFASSNPPD